MNPFSQYYDLKKAERALDFAIRFTPQYGDSFIEMLKLKVIMNDF